jgi:hypothetical protein
MYLVQKLFCNLEDYKISFCKLLLYSDRLIDLG